MNQQSAAISPSANGPVNDKFLIPNEEAANTIVADLKDKEFVLSRIERKQRKTDALSSVHYEHIAAGSDKKVEVLCKEDDDGGTAAL